MMAKSTRDVVRVKGFTYNTEEEWRIYEEINPTPFG
jgi:hypothetical protein